LCGDFSFELTNFPVDDLANVMPGKTVAVDIATTKMKHKIITGYIDSVRRTASGGGSQFEFSGRDKTSDLVDSSALYKTSSWRKAVLSKIVTDICEPFDVGVVTYLDEDPTVEEFTLQTGETAFGAIERLCRAFAILPVTDSEGFLTLTSVGDSKADIRLVVGDNVKYLEVEEDDSGRFSEYYFKGQAKGNGSSWQKKNTQLVGLSWDDDVSRYRPFVCMCEKKMTRTEIAKRARWEAQVRAGRALRCSVTVLGWLQEPNKIDSRPWEINELIELQYDAWDIDAELVISSVTFGLNEADGRFTNLELSPPEIFAANPSERIELSRRSRVRPVD
jgi:prophage tail gpP-like protein